jgi:4-carboxymuconolactone decarboxylase
MDGGIPASTWSTLSAELDHRQLLDVSFTVGGYDILARMMNSLELPIDDEIHDLTLRYEELF